MKLPKIDLSEVVATLLARGEPLTAAQLAAATGKSQPSVSLALRKLGERVHRMGAARNTRYALAQSVDESQDDVFALNMGWWQQGQSNPRFAQLTYLVGDHLHIRHPMREWFTHSRLPWFLEPLRPAGFLGRELLRMRPLWNGDPEKLNMRQILAINASAQGLFDPPGAITLSATQWHFGTWPAFSSDEIQRGHEYDELAEKIHERLPARSSAGGEQPKFTGHATGHDYVIKFSPPHGTPFGSRWTSLLRLEMLALDVLHRNGIESANTQLLMSTKRSYLESQRFDRYLVDQTLYRRHVVSIRAIHDEFVKGSWTNWLASSEALAKLGLITQQELQNIASIFAFGHYIGNTDMHSGNLSFFVDDVITPKIRLAPVYDMLPMMWRPDIHQGVLTDSPVRPQRMPTGFTAEQAQARLWAIEFWEQAAQLDIGADLQAASLESARRLKTNFADL